jgi:hypothetical protein
LLKIRLSLSDRRVRTKAVIEATNTVSVTAEPVIIRLFPRLREVKNIFAKRTKQRKPIGAVRPSR